MGVALREEWLIGGVMVDVVLSCLPSLHLRLGDLLQWFICRMIMCTSCFSVAHELTQHRENTNIDDDDILLSLDNGGGAFAANDSECPVSNTRDSSLECVEACQRLRSC